MRPAPLLLIALLLCGCHRPSSSAGAGGQTISMRQPWADAVGAARRSGLTVHDAAGLDMLSAPDGFYLEIPGDQALLVFRGGETDTVAALQRVEHWSASKSGRVYFELQSYELPAKP